MSYLRRMASGNAALSIGKCNSGGKQRESTLKMISGAIGPIMTYAWDTPVLLTFGAKRVNDPLQLMGNSILPRMEYLMLANMAKHA